MSSPPHTTDAVASYDWADDTDEELDFSAPVFSDDEGLSAELIYPAKPPPAAGAEASHDTHANGPLNGDGGLAVREREPSASATRPDRRQGAEGGGREGGWERGRGADSRDWERGGGPRYTPSSSSSSSRQDRKQTQRSFDSSRLGLRTEQSPSTSSLRDRTRSPSSAISSEGGAGGRRREVIPLPPKPAPDLDANNPTSRVSRSRSPAYRSQSPMARDAETSWRKRQEDQPHHHNHHDQQSLSPSVVPTMDRRRSTSAPRSRSPPQRRQPRTQMDRVIPTGSSPSPSSSSSSSRRHPEDKSNQDRWDKVYVEDKPYPTRRSSPPRRDREWERRRDQDQEREDSDTVYFKNREGRRQPSRDADHHHHHHHQQQQQHHRHTGLYSEQMEREDRRQRDKRHPQPSIDVSSRISADRWEKAADMEPDLPYPERARTRSPRGRDRERERDRQSSTADRDPRPPGRSSHSPEVRFKGAHKAGRDSHDSPVAAAAAVAATVPVSDREKDKREQKSSSHSLERQQQPSSSLSSDKWEQPAHAAPKKPAIHEESKPIPKKSSGAEREGRGGSTNSRGSRGRDVPADAQTRTGPSARGRGGSDRNHNNNNNNNGDRQNSQQQSGRQGKDKTPWWEDATYKASPPASAPTKEKKKKDDPASVPWWEQATYAAKPNATTTSSASASNGSSKEMTTLQGSPGRDKKSTLESIGLLSRDGETSASAPSVKDRKVQEVLLNELEEKVTRLDNTFGPPVVGTTTKSPAQVSQLEGIVEAFRKLREGLFATEAKDAFAARVYEQSVLSSLRAGNVPELIKALHQLVHEIHPAAHPLTFSASNGPQGPRTLEDWECAVQQLNETRKQFLGLYILFHLAKGPTLTCLDRARHGVIAVEGGSLSMLASPKTEADRIIAHLLPLCTRLGSRRPGTTGASTSQDGLKSVFGADLAFALSYWKCLRESDWNGRERLLKQPSVTWAQLLTIQHSLGDDLHTSRTLTVAIKSKAYYSLSVKRMADGVGMSVSNTEEAVDKLKKSYGLRSNIVVQNDNLMFKAK
ncbi:hypothetical protein DFQ27_008457 [Actinomortierella ambigua]|uniref:Uncharacterized protein n=1 Tax=Actinomortierella ambigua TaxID=1343610 RepID=A0A9P6QI60_9FUNG|nr:hypothetical protein DFQ27_008457 [Actinomortierella ambigua]